jgi:formylglycine-generating enzyme required for sulfatase activity
MRYSTSTRSAFILAIATVLAAGCKKAPQAAGDGVTMQFVRIPAGDFMMGSPIGEPGRRGNEGPQHQVKVSEPFYMLATEVTQQQYVQLMGVNPSVFKGADSPVEMVSWNDAMQFCRKLSEKTGKGITLPTEAQWEYACRAGADTRFSFGDDDELLDSYCWYGINSGTRTHPVGTKKPNAWGLYDMHGNVQEWCSDRFDYEYCSNSSNVDPRGPSNGEIELRVMRGGAHPYVADFCRSATRTGSTPDDLGGVLGFRIVFPARADSDKDIISIALATGTEKLVIAQEQTSEPRLTDGLIITGVVRDVANMPIDGVEIGILRAANSDFRLRGEGRFEVSWEPYRSRGRKFRYYLLARHTQRNLVAFVEINQDTRRLDVKLKPGAVLKGTIVNTDGRGIKGAHITPIFQNWRATLPSLMMRTDTQGRFEVRALPWNYKYSLLLRARGYGREEVEIQTNNASDNRVDIGQTVLGTANLTVSGIVVDANDQPVGLALVHCTGKGQEVASGLTGPDGEFKLDGVCKGKVKISASVGGSNRTNMSGSIETEAGATNVKVVMRKSSVPLPKGRTCFPGETEVWENGAVVLISEVGRGRGIPGTPYGSIERIDEHEGAFECRDILLDSGNRISVVDSHCFMLDSGKWIAAQDLRAGLRLRTLNGTVGIKSVRTRKKPYIGKVYNLKISHSDRYLVGRDGVIVRDH